MILFGLGKVSLLRNFNQFKKYVPASLDFPCGFMYNILQGVQSLFQNQTPPAERRTGYG